MSRDSPLETPIQYLKGVGPKRAAYLNRLGVETVYDLLFLAPRRYLDRTRLYIREIQSGLDVSVWGTISDVQVRMTRTGKQLVSILVRDHSGTIPVVWFNRRGLKFDVGQEIIVAGRVRESQPVGYAGRHFPRDGALSLGNYRPPATAQLRLVNPQFQVIDQTDEESQFVPQVIAIYPMTEGLKFWTMRRLVRVAVDKYIGFLPETLSPQLLAKYSLPAIKQTITALHFPESVADGLKARERLVFDELFYFQLSMALRKQQNTHLPKGSAMLDTGRLTSPFRAALPFQLTVAQERILAEIKRDMAASTRMERLLQGDVGSGKTVLAIYAMLVAVENGYQSVMMAPTEILAEQHYRVWNERLDDIGVHSCLLTGSVKAKARRVVLEQVAKNGCDILFGTHALIEEEVKFDRLGLVVIDEQHRFGAMQRLALLNKGVNPDFLVMTATPIPRTIALTLYGDLDVSRLDEKPPGRQITRTFLRTDDKRQDIYKFVLQKVGEGHQVFVVCPLIEESEKLDIAAATKTFEEMKQAFPGIMVGLLHGRLKNDDRVRVMEDFRAGKLSILVSTTVVEVGVDIPNATVMIIEHPERFGLAQLHQLRGRIGRGADVSYCILIHPFTRNDEIMSRLRFFEKTHDGFLLAEKDLELRKEGDLYGLSGRQHGRGSFRVADPRRDIEILERARLEAFGVLESDTHLSRPENRVFKDSVQPLYVVNNHLPG